MAINFPNTSIDSNGSRLRVNGYFRSENATVPAFMARLDQNTPITTGNGRPMTWDQQTYDDGNNFDGQLFTAPLDGVYFFYVWLMDENDGSNTNDYYTIRRNNNNSNFNSVLRVYSSGRSNHHHQWPGGTIFELAEGDNVRVYLDRSDVGMYGNDHHYTLFCGCYLGRT